MLSPKKIELSPSSFQFKAIFFHCIAFKILSHDLDEIEHDLAETMRQSPQFFTASLVIIDLEKLQPQWLMDFEHLKRLLLSHGIVAVGVRGGSIEQQQAAALCGLPLVKTGLSPTKEEKPSTAIPAPTIASKIITQPIRSGVQVYAKTGDLIVTAQVSPGAELMADGHIHVYGTLRGKALAGIHGNKDAKIFCLSLKAELVAIAGHYLTQEDIALSKDYHGPIQIYLNKEQLIIERL